MLDQIYRGIKGSLTLLVIGIVLLALVASCAPAPTPTPTLKPVAATPTPVPPTPAAEPLKIPCGKTLTSGNCFYGYNYYEEMAMQACRLAAEEINDAGGVLGRPLEIWPLDDKADPKEGAIIAHQICDDPGIVVAYAHDFSTVMLAVEHIYNECGLPILTHACTSQIVERGYDNVFQHPINAYTLAWGMADAADQIAGIKSVAIMHDKDAYQEGYAMAFRDKCKELGIEVTSFQGVTAGGVDYSPVLTKIKDENPEAVFVAVVGAPRMLIPKQMRELGMDQRLIIPEAYEDRTRELAMDQMYLAPEAYEDSIEFIAGVGEAGVGTLTCAAKPVPGGPSEKTFEEWADRFEERWGERPDPEILWHYQVIQVIADAIERAGKFDREAIKEALRETDYDGPAYRVKWDDKGMLVGGSITAWELQPSLEFECLAQYDAESGKFTMLK